MRRRDLIFLCLIWGAVLGGLAWALSTQLRWVQESKPPRVQAPVKPEEGEPGALPASATGVIGNVSEDTVAAMAKGLSRPTPKKPDPKVTPAPKPAAPK